MRQHPTPWRAEVQRGTNRSRIWDANGHQVIAGMNNEKAAFITSAVNRSVVDVCREDVEAAEAYLGGFMGELSSYNKVEALRKRLRAVLKARS